MAIQRTGGLSPGSGWEELEVLGKQIDPPTVPSPTTSSEFSALVDAFEIAAPPDAFSVGPSSPWPFFVGAEIAASTPREDDPATPAFPFCC